MRKIIVAGAGQIGSRYLQGLAKVAQPLEIWAYDISPQALAVARQRWGEANPNHGHYIHFSSNLSAFPHAFDLSIVACTADARPKLVQAVARHAEIKAWILEKLLAQSIQGCRAIVTAIPSESRAWVNTPLHIYPLFAEIKARVGKRPLHAEFLNITGIACTTIHYIDYVARCTGAKITYVDTSELTSWDTYLNRPKFLDVNGRLRVVFSDGSTILVSGTTQVLPSGKSFKIRCGATECGETWQIWDLEGRATSSRGYHIEAPGFCYQSEMTPWVVEAIFTNQNPNLPTLEQSLEQHELLLEALVNHWNQVMPVGSTEIPVT